MRKKIMLTLVISSLLVFFVMPERAVPFVQREAGRTYIVDQTGERWDVTEAEARGFKPESFQYGIGRDAFQTLDDSHVDEDRYDVSPGLRVIGVSKGREAQAYSVSRLRYHEVANTHVGSSPVSVAY